MRATIKDIAKLAGVSHSTVSRVQNGAPIRVSEATRNKILAIAKKVNYTPNRPARTLKTGRHHVIAVIAYDITDAFAIECISTMEAHLEQTSYRAQWLSCAHASGPERKPVQMLYDVAEYADGMIILEADRGLPDAELLRFWTATNMPIVTVIRKVPGEMISSVTIDDEAGTERLVRHLVGLGHKRIGFCYHRHRPPTAEARHVVFDRLVGELGLSDDPNLQVPVECDAKDAYHAGLTLLDLPTPPTAIIAFCDLTAIGVLKACFDRNVRVPDDVSIASFDNIRMSELTSPALTTIAANYTEIADLALKELIDQIERKDLANAAVHHHVTQSELIVRQSTEAVRQADGTSV